MDTMQRLTAYLRNRPVELKHIKDSGEKKIVAHFVGDYLPVEIIHAAGAVPLGLVHGGDPEAVEAAHRAILRYLCPFSRAQFGYWVLGEQSYYSLFDLLVAPITCQHLRRAADLYNVHTDVPIFRLGVPQPYDGEQGAQYFSEGLEFLKQRVEELTGNKVTEAKLRESIALYARMRDLLRQISELRKSPRPPITTTEFIKLNHAAHIADPNFMVELLDTLYQELRDKEGPERTGPRILITGPNIALGDYKVLDLIEECGGTVVVEDIAEGVIFYWENVATDGDPMAALVDRYIRRRPVNCSFMRPTMDQHFDFIIKLADDFSVDGIVWYQLRMCETWSIESFFLADRMKARDASLPMLKLDSEYDVADRGPLRTRIETFIETLEGRTLACSKV